MLPKELKALIEFARKALRQFKLLEETQLTPGQITDYANKFTTMKCVFMSSSDVKSKEYLANSLKILDYFILAIPTHIFDTIEAGLNANQGHFAIAISVNDKLEKEGANGMARYMGKKRLPEYVNHERLYKKMLWLEWLLHHLLRLVEQGKIVDFKVPLPGVDGPKDQLLSRFKHTQSFIDLHAKNNPNEQEIITHFRKSYQCEELEMSFSNAEQAFGKVFTVKEENLNDTATQSTVQPS